MEQSKFEGISFGSLFIWNAYKYVKICMLSIIELFCMPQNRCPVISLSSLSLECCYSVLLQCNVLVQKLLLGQLSHNCSIHSYTFNQIQHLVFLFLYISFLLFYPLIGRPVVLFTAQTWMGYIKLVLTTWCSERALTHSPMYTEE